MIAFHRTDLSPPTLARKHVLKDQDHLFGDSSPGTYGAHVQSRCGGEWAEESEVMVSLWDEDNGFEPCPECDYLIRLEIRSNAR